MPEQWKTRNTVKGRDVRNEKIQWIWSEKMWELERGHRKSSSHREPSVAVKEMNLHKDKTFQFPSKLNANTLMPGHIRANIKKKKKFLKASEKKHVSYKGMIRLLDSNHRCQMPENNARLCVSSTRWGKTTVFLCAVLSCIITWVFSQKVTTHKP